VAEDNAMNRRLITKVLESAGHRVWTAANGKEAAQSVQTEGFDLILMDVEMPNMDGLESTRAIRAAEAPNLHVPIYALTAHASPDDRARCLAAGMDGFVTKPIAMDEVLQLVSKLVAAETKDITIEPSDNAFTPEYVEQEVTASNEDSGESSLALEASPHNLQDFTAATASTDSLHVEDGFSDATSPAFNAEMIGVLAGIEDSYGDSDDHGPAASARLSAPVGLALLEATCQLTQPSPSLMKQDDGPTATAACDPFEQARKSLSKSSFGIRVIHNDGYPSDRNLI
jgi:CheY-like chemotaxis protein